MIAEGRKERGGEEGSWRVPPAGRLPLALHEHTTPPCLLFEHPGRNWCEELNHLRCDRELAEPSFHPGSSSHLRLLTFSVSRELHFQTP